MHPFSILTLGIFVAGYITARWDLVTRLHELAIFAWDYGVVVGLCFCPINCARVANRVTRITAKQSRAAKGFAALTLVFLLVFIPVERLATREANLVRPPYLLRLPSPDLESFLTDHALVAFFSTHAHQDLVYLRENN